MKTAVIIFPASNCDRDAFTVLSRISGEASRPSEPSACDLSAEALAKAEATTHVRAVGEHGGNVIKIWHQETELPKVDLVFLPGGFSYGDYLRSGAMAARSPIMQAVKAHAERGGYVMGVCNGFQILTESGLLPGTLTRNQGQTFICKTVGLRVETTASSFTHAYRKHQAIDIPIAHHDGCYIADEVTLKALNDEDQVAFRYCDANGEINDATNPNGSVENIAGILNKQRNILGMMPHPERHAETLLGGVDGELLFKGLLAA